MRKTIVTTLLLAFLLNGVISYFWPAFVWLNIIFLILSTVAIYDIYISKHNVLRNYPIVGHLRYMLEFISPEIHQYFVEGPHDGAPFNREQRKIIYDRAEGVNDTMPFGTQYNLLASGIEFAYHSLYPKQVAAQQMRVAIGGSKCKQIYLASRLNISAMSFGALSKNSILALNHGAQLGSFYHNTGEGGLSPYHQQYGADLCWQIGTGYFGCRTPEGGFSPELFAKTAALPQVKMIEIKLSQGAKPSHGGILPAAKITNEIARIRLIPQDKDCISPPSHTAFNGPEGLLAFIAQLRELSDGKPIGFKLCIGRRHEFFAIVKAMIATGITPDFITIDGAEGGTGAAPYEFSNRLGMPLIEGLNFVHNALLGANLRDQIKLIASGKITTGFDILSKIALGADMVNMARPMMFALGCIQARRCDSNTCPSGVATQDPARGAAVDPNTHGKKVNNLHQASLRSFSNLLGAMGHTSPEQLTASQIYRRLDNGQSISYAELLPQLTAGQLLTDDIPAFYSSDWQQA
ncbi:FMN-binding glutamate synthase family protein [Colwellia sp. MEBiC06753]